MLKSFSVLTLASAVAMNDGRLATAQPQAAPNRADNARAATPEAADPLPPTAGPPAATEAQQEPGYLGVVTDDRREARRGVRIVTVAPRSPAEVAGLRPGDLIVAIAGQPIRETRDFAGVLQNSAIGQQLAIRVQRDGRPVDVSVTLGSRPPVGQRLYDQFGRIPETLPQPDGAPEAPAQARGLLGVRAIPLSPEAQNFLGLRTRAGALVTQVLAGSPAAAARIPLEAVIVAVDGARVADPTELSRLINAAGNGGRVEIEFYARGQLVKRTVILGQYSEAPTPADALTVGPPGDDVPAPPSPALSIEAIAERLDALERRISELEDAVRRLTPAQP